MPAPNYHPFAPWTEAVLQTLLARGKRYFVRQTFARARTRNQPRAFLLSAYGPDQENLLDLHRQAVHSDSYARVYDSQHPEDLRRLRRATQTMEGVGVYYAGQRGTGWTPPPAYAAKIKRFLHHHPAVTQARGQIQVGIGQKFGKLYLTVGFPPQSICVPLEQIDNY